jgi:methylmalonyl-CoA carboxyltransferase large subunit
MAQTEDRGSRIEDRGLSGTGDWAQVTAALRELRQEVVRLGERVAALEAAAGGDRGRPSLDPRSSILDPRPKAEGLSEELLLVISAAVAAFLGKKPHIRQIRLVGTAAWAQQGRVTIQASHTLSRHTRSEP